MGGDAAQNVSLGPQRDKGQDVAGDHSDIERLVYANRREVKHGEVGDDPLRTGIVLMGCGDELVVGINADHVMTARMQDRSDASGAASGVEDARAGSRQCVDEARLAP
jgi:hypothetical protein